MTDENFKLTRRKALAGLATVGVAGAGAGLGTSAYFSDTESFEDNIVEAGTLDMSVTAEVAAHVNNDYWNGLTLESVTADGEAAVFLNVDDVKPGDWAIVCFDIDVAENPAYVQISADDLVSNENGYTEPEPEDGNGEGELEENIVAELYGSFDGSADSNPPRSHLSNLQDGVTPEDSTLAEAYAAFETGVTVGGSEEPMPVGSGEDSVEYCLLLWIPADVGNEIQGDSLSFDLVFNAEQVRNNDDPFSGGS